MCVHLICDKETVLVECWGLIDADLNGPHGHRFRSKHLIGRHDIQGSKQCDLVGTYQGIVLRVKGVNEGAWVEVYDPFRGCHSREFGVDGNRRDTGVKFVQRGGVLELKLLAVIFNEPNLAEFIRASGTGTNDEASIAHLIGQHSGRGSCPNAASCAEGEFQVPSVLIIGWIFWIVATVPRILNGVNPVSGNKMLLIYLLLSERLSGE